MSLVISTYIPTGGATATRNADVLPFPFPARPQAITGYARFVELGTILSPPLGGEPTRRVLHIGKSDNTSPRFGINRDTSGNYAGFINNGTGESDRQSILAAAPSIGNIVELRITLDENGAVQLHQSIDSAAETNAVASADGEIPQVWSQALLFLNSVGNTATGFNAFRNVFFHRGVQSLATMRRLAGV